MMFRDRVRLTGFEFVVVQGMLSVDQSSESEEEDELHYDMEEDVPR